MRTDSEVNESTKAAMNKYLRSGELEKGRILFAILQDIEDKLSELGDTDTPEGDQNSEDEPVDDSSETTHIQEDE